MCLKALKRLNPDNCSLLLYFLKVFVAYYFFVKLEPSCIFVEMSEEVSQLIFGLEFLTLFVKTKVRLLQEGRMGNVAGLIQTFMSHLSFTS